MAYDGSIGSTFYQNTPWFASEKIVSLKLKHHALDRHIAMFLCRLIHNQKNKYSYGYKWSVGLRMNRGKILLPVTDGGAPDFEYMAAYVRNIEEHILQRYREFISIVPPPKKIQSLNEKLWREFFIGELFRLEAGKSKGLTHLAADERGISYLGATNRNNAVLSFVRPVEDLIQRGNCIAFIRNGEGSIGYSVYKREDFIVTSDITCGYADFLNEFVGLFITTIADKVRGKYNFNYKRSDSRLKREKIQLPVTDDGAPDFAYMAAYAKNLVAEQYRRYLAYIDGE
ncbi:MAG: restriction endonuclease subunit S [Quinella sp. 1Q7]|nr:restriction endonuclease subunit S [Quinella sp. 1Q7]